MAGQMLMDLLFFMMQLFIKNGIVRLIEKFFSEDKVKNMVTAEDFLLSNWYATVIFPGNSVSGPGTLKDHDGKSLKVLMMRKKNIN